MLRIAKYLGNAGSYTAARDLVRQVLQAQEASLGTGHAGPMTARADLASWTRQAEETG
jgi:hypothetical protein